MTLKQKTFTAFLVMLLLPIVLTAGAAVLGMRFEVMRFKQEYDVDVTALEVINSPAVVLSRMTQTAFSELSNAAAFDPSKFTDVIWLDEADEVLNNKFSYLVVIKGEVPTYIGQRGTEFASISERVIMSSSTGETTTSNAAMLFNDRKVIIKFGAIYFSDDVRGSFVIVSDLGPMLSASRGRLIFTFAAGGLIVLIVTVVLMMWVYKSLLRPVLALRNATRELGKGDLNYRLERKEKDEIGEICANFEEMRRHLKTQIDAKEQYELDVREMVSNVSHDLKTPLTAIKGYAEGMLDGVADTEEKRAKYLKTIAVKANDMTTLVEELSYFSKLDTNKMPYKFEIIDANGYFSDCVDEYAIELEMKDFEIHFVSEIEPGTLVSIDTEQIRRVMNNLVGNAVKYRNNDIHGVMNVRLTDANDSVRVSVSDNGIGISKTALPHIFDRFYRADKSRTAGRAGTGIGLAIVKKIVEEHGGRVFARSELGSGTTISFTVKKGAK